MRLVGRDPSPHAPGMFVVTEEEAAAIRAALHQGGELAAAVELRWLFPGVTDNEQARACARTRVEGPQWVESGRTQQKLSRDWG